ncbi:MAG: Rrf2 family transcriptional regulator [Acidobacteria bacterium]|nr:Rrf2 family transcriptional regulator [Acidobacteriota bacterium]
MTPYPRPVQQAIRALTTLAAEEKGSVVRAGKLASRESIPATALSKTLQQLARKGLLQSVQGRGGGFKLARSSRDITVADIVDAVQGPAAVSRCSLGYANCRPRNLCYIDTLLAEARAAFRAQLEQTTLYNLARRRKAIRKRKSLKKN